jgi:type II secretory pathway component PulK
VRRFEATVERRRAVRSKRAQTGAALLLVLWTFAVLSVLAAEFARAMRQEAEATRYFKEETSAHYVAIAGLNEAILAIDTYRGENLDDQSDDDADEGDEGSGPSVNDQGNGLGSDQQDAWMEPIRTLLNGQGAWVKETFDGVDYEVRAVDETGKIAINAREVDEVVLGRILENLGYDEADSRVVADSIMDWRDEDDLHRDNGAEDDYYEALPRPYSCKDAPFDSIEELLLVRGVTREMYYGSKDVPGLRDIFSVYNPSARLTVSSLSEPVRYALCGEDALQQDDPDRVGGTGFNDDIAVDLTQCLQETGLPQRRGNQQLTIATVEARVKDASQRTLSHVGATIRFRGDGFQTYEWYDSIFDPDPDED